MGCKLQHRFRSPETDLVGYREVTRTSTLVVQGATTKLMHANTYLRGTGILIQMIAHTDADRFETVLQRDCAGS